MLFIALKDVALALKKQGKTSTVNSTDEQQSKTFIDLYHIFIVDSRITKSSDLMPIKSHVALSRSCSRTPPQIIKQDKREPISTSTNSSHIFSKILKLVPENLNVLRSFIPPLSRLCFWIQLALACTGLELPHTLCIQTRDATAVFAKQSNVAGYGTTVLGLCLISSVQFGGSNSIFAKDVLVDSRF